MTFFAKFDKYVDILQGTVYTVLVRVVQLKLWGNL